MVGGSGRPSSLYLLCTLHSFHLLGLLVSGCWGNHLVPSLAGLAPNLPLCPFGTSTLLSSTLPTNQQPHPCPEGAVQPSSNSCQESLGILFCQDSSLKGPGGDLNAYVIECTTRWSLVLIQSPVPSTGEGQPRPPWKCCLQWALYIMLFQCST